ncbi:MAG: IclR family transcriptional regulator [Pseudaminobacter sp.]
MSDRYSGIKSVDVACRIIEAFANDGPRLALKDLASTLRIPASKVHRYLGSMVRGGLIEQDAATRHYMLGRVAFEIGLRAIAAHDPLRAAIQVQKELRDKIDQSVALSVWGNKGPTIVHVEDSSQPVIMTMKVGAVLPTLSTATGLVFCALLPTVITRPLVDEAFAELDRTDSIVSTRTALKKTLEEIRRVHFAVNRGHLTPQVCAIAVPFFGRRDQLTAVLAVIAREEEIDRNKNHIVRFVRDRSRDMTRPI